MGVRVVLARISDDALDLESHLAAVNSAEYGAVATFIGQVRNHDREAQGEVTALEYTSHPEAETFLNRVCAEVVSEHSGEATIAVSHRIGHLEVGDLALVVAVASAHRELALTLCSQVVEAVKHGVPIWKKQLTADGHTWPGLANC